jgi:hypothetical protein
MSTPMPVKPTCPCCGHKFESVSFSNTNTFGPLTTDLYRQTAGFPSLPLMVHGCDKYGYAGMLVSFKPGSTTSALDEWVKANLGTRTEGFPAGAKYENAARIAEYLGARPREAANIWLRAAWCESGNHRPGKRYRREAVLRFEAAMNSAGSAEGAGARHLSSR